jgi:hypothetical protein
MRGGYRKAQFGFGSFLCIPLFVGQLNIKHKKDSLFSERNGNRTRPTVVIGQLRFTWVKWVRQ